MKNSTLLESKTEIKSCEPHSCRFFMAGDIVDAKKVTGKFCIKIGWCVTIAPTDYIYSGGQQTGFIEVINYARFPIKIKEIHRRLHELAKKLVFELNQKSYSVFDSIRSEYITFTMPFA